MSTKNHYTPSVRDDQTGGATDQTGVGPESIAGAEASELPDHGRGGPETNIGKEMGRKLPQDTGGPSARPTPGSRPRSTSARFVTTAAAAGGGRIDAGRRVDQCVADRSPGMPFRGSAVYRPAFDSYHRRTWRRRYLPRKRRSGRLLAARPLRDLAQQLSAAPAAAVSGLWGPAWPPVLASLQRELHRPVLLVCGHLDEADDLADDLQLFLGGDETRSAARA